MLTNRHGGEQFKSSPAMLSLHTKIKAFYSATSLLIKVFKQKWSELILSHFLPSCPKCVRQRLAKLVGGEGVEEEESFVTVDSMERLSELVQTQSELKMLRFILRTPAGS